ncbi:MAG: hypothetical protein QOJ99_473 [Bryobacterales bacterium]|jgi:hypothetical protein|nr:hypothetical protein [Bryobacterales bacterium]
MNLISRTLRMITVCVLSGTCVPMIMMAQQDPRDLTGSTLEDLMLCWSQKTPENRGV